MIFVTRYADDGPTVMELDEAGIDWLTAGLEQLRGQEPGGELACPSFVEGDDGMPTAATEFVLRRA